MNIFGLKVTQCYFNVVQVLTKHKRLSILTSDTCWAFTSWHQRKRPVSRTVFATWGCEWSVRSELWDTLWWRIRCRSSLFETDTLSSPLKCNQCQAKNTKRTTNCCWCMLIIQIVKPANQIQIKLKERDAEICLIIELFPPEKFKAVSKTLSISPFFKHGVKF